jgi:hypothetical protein
VRTSGFTQSHKHCSTDGSSLRGTLRGCCPEQRTAVACRVVDWTCVLSCGRALQQLFRHHAAGFGVEISACSCVCGAGISLVGLVFSLHAFIAYRLCLVLRRALLLLVRSGLRFCLGQFSIGVCLCLADSHKCGWQLSSAQVWDAASVTGLIGLRFRLVCDGLTSMYVCKEGCAASCRLRSRVPWCPAYSSQCMHCVCAIC